MLAQLSLLRRARVETVTIPVFVISAQPGSSVGMPGIGGKGSIAMSPAGGDKPGLGGSGGGTGIGHGEGSGSGLTGEKIRKIRVREIPEVAAAPISMLAREFLPLPVLAAQATLPLDPPQCPAWTFAAAAPS